MSRNRFDVLRGEVGESSGSVRIVDDGADSSDDEEVIEVYNETNDFLKVDPNNDIHKKGASTPSSGGLND